MTKQEDTVTTGNYLLQKLKQQRGFLFFLLLMISVRWSFADHYRVPTGSMIPTIQVGDHVFTNKMAYDLKLPFTDVVLAQTGAPERGDIIVFKFPKDPSINFVKRLIALPGDRVEISNGLVKVNGRLALADEDEAINLIERLHTTSENFEYFEKLDGKTYSVQRVPSETRNQTISFVVPQDQFFFMGDNRDQSDDSRYWGFVPRENLKGKVTNVTISVALNGFLPELNFGRFGKELL